LADMIRDAAGIGDLLKARREAWQAQMCIAPRTGRPRHAQRERHPNYSTGQMVATIEKVAAVPT